MRRYWAGLATILLGIPIGLLAQQVGLPHKAVFLAFAVGGGVMQASVFIRAYKEMRLLDQRFRSTIEGMRILISQR